MITLNASGGSVTFTFSGNSTYLNDGTITVPVNSLALIIDESDMATFKKSQSSDIFVSANIAEFGMTKAELESWYKANMVGSTGGGVDSGTVQTMIDESISGKADTDSLSAYTINEGVAESSQTYDVEVTNDPPVNVYTLDKPYGGIKMFLSHSGYTSSMRPVLICYDDNDNEIGRIWISDRTTASNPFVDYSGFTDLVKNEVDGGYSVIVEGEELTAVKKFTYYEEYWATDEETSVLFFNNAYNITNAVRFDLSKKVDTSAITTSITSGSTDSEVPSAKAVYDYVDAKVAEAGGGKAVSGGTNISITTGETADTINCTLPITAGTGWHSIKIGSGSQAGGNSSVAEGYVTYANGDEGAHAEGKTTYANGKSSHAEGNNSKANGNCSHAEGTGTNASGHNSHAEGVVTQAIGRFSHTEGYHTIANWDAEHASGQYNVSSSGSSTFGDSGNTLFSVGNGTAENARHNAFEIRQNGDIYLSSGGTDIKLQDYLGGSSIEVTSAVTSGSTDVLTSGGAYEQFGGLKLVKLTESEYTALVTKDPNVLYVVIPDPLNP